MAGKQTRDLLLACLRLDEGEALQSMLARLPAADWMALMTLAGKQRVLALLLHQIQALGVEELVPPEHLNRLRQRTAFTAKRNLALYGEVRRLVAAFREHEIPVIGLKGIYLAAAVYPTMAVREMGDLDLLLPPAGLPTGIKIMAAAGYTTRKPLQTMAAYRATGHHLPPFVKPPRTRVELHWQLTNPDQPVVIDIDAWWRRARPVDLCGASALGLAPEDLLHHLCLHASYQHQFAFGLRSLADVAWTIETFKLELDWDAFGQEVAAAGSARGTFMALRLAADLFGAGVPEEILADLNPKASSAEVFGVAGRQLFTEANEARRLSGNLALLAGQQGRLGGLKHLVRTIFPSRRQMSLQYAVDPGSPWMIWYYFFRIGDLLLRHGSHVLRMWRGERAVGALAGRKRVLAAWLAGSEPETDVKRGDV